MMIVSNTSPLIAFSKIDRFDILQEVFKKVTIPEAVQEEILANCTKIEKKRFIAACETFVNKVKVKEVYNFSRRLGKGEQEALTIAIQEHADLLLIDDRKGSNEAKEHNIPIASTRAILKFAEKQNIISNYQEVEQALKKQSFFVPNY